jgi:hypothetical protein
MRRSALRAGLFKGEGGGSVAKVLLKRAEEGADPTVDIQVRRCVLSIQRRKRWT